MEKQFYQWLRANLPPSDKLNLGIGDDAAVLKPLGRAGLVCTTDTLTDEVDFLIDEVDPAAIGHKALGVNLSDLAAMAAEPQACVVSLVLPRNGTARLTAYELAVEIYRGLLPLAKEHQIAVAGGDTNAWDGPLVISVTALGSTTARGSLTRSGAQPGDALLVTGNLGGSILGRHLAVQPRVREALLLQERYELHAGIDISDGLALDASRLAEASECGVELELSAIPIADAAKELSQQTGKSALEHAFGDGEDFELLLAVSPDVAERILAEQPLEVSVTRIGTFVERAGLWQRDADGKVSPLEAQGYLH